MNSTMSNKEISEQKKKNLKAATPQKPKRRNYKKELEKALVEAGELKDQLLRTAAEFDNFRKRSISEKISLISQANAEFVALLLPVLDDFDRFAQLGEETDVASLYQGFGMINSKFQKLLENQGLSHMQAVGEPFDPEKHDALMQIEAKDTDSDIVVEEHEKGYEFHGRVVRHAKVIVSK